MDCPLFPTILYKESNYNTNPNTCGAKQWASNFHVAVSYQV